MFVNNSCADFHESPMNHLVDYARSVTGGRRMKIFSTKEVPFLLPKELLTRIPLLPHRKQAASPGQNPITFLF